MNFNEVLVVRPTTTEENEFMITMGNELATQEKFPTRKKAEARIAKTDWNLVAVMVWKIAQEIINDKKEQK